MNDEALQIPVRGRERRKKEKEEPFLVTVDGGERGKEEGSEALQYGKGENGLCERNHREVWGM